MRNNTKTQICSEVIRNASALCAMNVEIVKQLLIGFRTDNGEIQCYSSKG